MKKPYIYNSWRGRKKYRISPYCKCETKKAMANVPELCAVCFKRMPEKGGEKRD